MQDCLGFQEQVAHQFLAQQNTLISQYQDVDPQEQQANEQNSPVLTDYNDSQFCVNQQIFISNSELYQMSYVDQEPQDDNNNQDLQNLNQQPNFRKEVNKRKMNETLNMHSQQQQNNYQEGIQRNFYENFTHDHISQYNFQQQQQQYTNQKEKTDQNYILQELPQIREDGYNQNRMQRLYNTQQQFSNNQDLQTSNNNSWQQRQIPCNQPTFSPKKQINMTLQKITADISNQNNYLTKSRQSQLTEKLNIQNNSNNLGYSIAIEVEEKEQNAQQYIEEKSDSNEWNQNLESSNQLSNQIEDQQHENIPLETQNNIQGDDNNYNHTHKWIFYQFMKEFEKQVSDLNSQNELKKKYQLYEKNKDKKPQHKFIKLFKELKQQGFYFHNIQRAEMENDFDSFKKQCIDLLSKRQFKKDNVNLHSGTIIKKYKILFEQLKQFIKIDDKSQE